MNLSRNKELNTTLETVVKNIYSDVTMFPYITTMNIHCGIFVKRKSKTDKSGTMGPYQLDPSRVAGAVKYPKATSRNTPIDMIEMEELTATNHDRTSRGNDFTNWFSKNFDNVLFLTREDDWDKVNSDGINADSIQERLKYNNKKMCNMSDNKDTIDKLIKFLVSGCYENVIRSAWTAVHKLPTDIVYIVPTYNCRNLQTASTGDILSCNFDHTIKHDLVPENLINYFIRDLKHAAKAGFTTRWSSMGTCPSLIHKKLQREVSEQHRYLFSHIHRCLPPDRNERHDLCFYNFWCKDYDSYESAVDRRIQPSWDFLLLSDEKYKCMKENACFECIALKYQQPSLVTNFQLTIHDKQLNPIITKSLSINGSPLHNIDAEMVALADTLINELDIESVPNEFGVYCDFSYGLQGENEFIVDPSGNETPFIYTDDKSKPFVDKKNYENKSTV